MADKIRHHYVPVGLSKNFCAEEKRLYLYDLLEQKIMPSSPKDAFLRKKLHSVVGDSGEVDHNLIEDEFMQIESIGLKAIKETIQGKGLDNNAKDLIGAFIALQYLRTPVSRSGIEKMLKKQLAATAKVLDMQGIFGEVPQALKPFGNTMSELIDSEAVNFQITLPQVTMQGLVALPKIHELLIQMNWCLLEASEDNYFLLSDHPVSILDPDIKKHGLGIGFVGKNIEVVMPIGLHHCVLLSWKDIPNNLNANKRQVMNINQRSAIFGERFFSFPIKSKKVMNFISRYKECNFGSVVENIPNLEGQLTVGQNSIVGNARLYEGIQPIF